jgi:O-antigen ligase
MAAAAPRYADRTAQWAAVGVGLTIPMTVALNNAFLALTVLAWLASGHYREKFGVFKHPASFAALVLYGLLVLGALYGDALGDAAMLHLRKYADLALIPVFLYIFRDPQTRRHATAALALGLAFVLTLSYLLKLGLPLEIPSALGDQAYPIVFKKHLTHNILMAFAALLYTWLALSAASQGLRLAWGALAILAVVNVTLMVQGATGYVVLCSLLLLLGYRRIGPRGLAGAIVGVTVLATALMMYTNPFQQRIYKIASELEAWRPDEPAQASTGWRLEFYRTTLSIIADHPLTGVGTGGFAQAYAAKIRDTDRTPTQNPHNEFLLMWTQLGVVGLAVFIWLFYRQWRLAAHLPTRLERELAYGLVVTMVIGCLLNSLLLDHTEGLFYAWLTGVLYGGLKYGEEKSNTA